MRIPTQVYVALVVASGIVSIVLWRELSTERQLTADLQTQLAAAKSALAARPAVQTAAAAMPPLPVATTSSEALAASPAKTARETAVAVMAESAKRQKTLLDDPEYRKARIAQRRVDLKQHYAGLAVELGLSDKEADALFDLLAEQQIRMEVEFSDRMAAGTTPDAATMAQMERFQKEQKDAVVAMLGPARTEQLEEYDHNQPSRTRVNNLTNLLARSGQPLSNAQSRSLSAVIVAEQKRMESEAQALRDAGKTSTQSPADIQAETNRRIIDNATGFLSAPQLEVVRGRFQQRATIDQASDRVQQREREVLQETPY